ncbi:MAG: hypothetical protein OXE42_02745 [Gammaproteobacteria bacterium]|nr:hypothetical protein [Gammaproteobacteria bacterium]
MSNELIAIIGVGVTLAGLILYSQHNLRADMQVQREETRAEFKAVRSEMKAEFRAVRSEIKAEFNKHLGAINSLREDVNRLHGRVARQEGLMEGLREAITGTRDLVAGPG